MIRRDFLRRLVLNSVCDDFENVDQVILRDVATAAAKCGLRVERSEVVDTLASLIADGLVKAYILPGPGSSPFSGELRGMPPESEAGGAHQGQCHNERLQRDEEDAL